MRKRNRHRPALLRTSRKESPPPRDRARRWPSPARRTACRSARRQGGSAARRIGKPAHRCWPRVRHRPPRARHGLPRRTATLGRQPSDESETRHNGTVRLPIRPRCNQPHLAPRIGRPGSGVHRQRHSGGNCIAGQHQNHATSASAQRTYRGCGEDTSPACGPIPPITRWRYPPVHFFHMTVSDSDL